MLPVVQDAIARDVKVTFEYRRADGDTAPRTVDPYGVVCKQNVWYLVARAPAGMRSYRVSRMSRAVALALKFKRPAKFNLAAHWKASTAALSEMQERYAATLALAPEAAQSLRGWCQLAPAGDVQLEEIPDGWGVHRVDFESPSQAQFVALGFGPRVRVLAPKNFRDRVSADVAAAYGVMSSRVR